MKIKTMTLKTKITLFITGAGFISSLIFSTVVFFELLEQPFDVLDAVLRQEANYICDVLERNRLQAGDEFLENISNADHGYWVEVYDGDSKQQLFKSAMARKVMIPVVAQSRQVVESIEDEHITGNDENSVEKKTAFRVRKIQIRKNETLYIVQIAFPIEKLEKEIRELSIGVISGFVVSMLVLVVLSRFLAGFMLKPLGNMNELALKVCDNNLGVRIPVGDSGDEFSEHARIINTMLDRINNSFVRQRSFLFDTSHELKTPLATLRLAVDEINHMKDEKFPTALLNSLDRMNTQILRMERLVKDLLKLASLEIVPTGDFHSVNMTELLQSLIDDYMFMIEAHGINIQIDLPVGLVVNGDEKMLRRAFSNILDNAVKYNIKAGVIKVQDERISSDLRICIGNSGQGVAASELHSVFD